MVQKIFFFGRLSIKTDNNNFKIKTNRNFFFFTNPTNQLNISQPPKTTYTRIKLLIHAEFRHFANRYSARFPITTVHRRYL